MIKNFVTALQFLTIITVKKDHPVEEGDLAKSMVYFPVVGFLIGVLLVYADKAFEVIVLPQTIATFLLVILSVLITRALHVDGLADTLDGLMGGRDHQSRLAIMKDSRIGTAGVVGILGVLFMKYLCLNSLFAGDRVGALLLAPVLGRWSQTFMVYKTKYGREEGMGRSFVGHFRSGSMLAVSLITVCLSAFVVVRLDPRSVFLFFSLLIGIVLMTWLAKRYLVNKLGGVTGDAIGAVSELNEVLVFLVFIVFSSES